MGRRAAILVFASTTVACTSLLGDFSTEGAGIDAGTTSGGAIPDAGSGPAIAAVQAAAADVSVYVRQAATLDASGSTASKGTPTFAWSLYTIPPGSSLTAHSLSGASTGHATIVPDVAGEYVLELTVRASGGSDTIRPKVTALLPEVLFARGSTGDAGTLPSAVYTLADSNGGGARDVLCPGVYDDAAATMPQLASYGGRAFDFWEGEAGQPSRFAAFTIDTVADGGLTAHLWAGTTASTCDAPPGDFGTASFGPGRPYGSSPHFNASGSRFVVYDRQWRIVTFPSDLAGQGVAPQVIATYPVPSSQARSALDTSGVDNGAGYIVEPPRVEWTGEALAWAQPTANGWEIVTAPDSADAGAPTVYMTCKGVTPRQIALLADGTVIASYRQSSQSPENLYQLKPNAQQVCSREQQYTNLSNASGASATDFAVSPDGTEIAFLALDPAQQDPSPWLEGSSQLPGGYLYAVPVGGGTPQQVSNDPALYGPRWIGGGTALEFTRLDGVVGSAGRLATSVVVVSPDGGAEQVVAAGDGISNFVSTSGNAACDVAGAEGLGRGSAAAAGFGVAAVAAFGVRGRRRNGRGQRRPTESRATPPRA
ncbi:MAG TPA: hypothetical protein VGM06_14895 [Polyangiaceae bacterium]|jgi:hypothetical protein